MRMLARSGGVFAPVMLTTVMATTLLLSGCGADAPTTAEDSGAEEAAPVVLTDRSFVSTAVAGDGLVAGSEITFTFEGDRLAVRGGCNTMAGVYTHDGETLAWDGPAISTKMACEPALMTQDETLNALLDEGVTTTTADGADLVLTSGDVSISLSEAE